MTEHALPDLSCPRCSKTSSGFAGCRPCADDGVAVNLVPRPADLSGRALGRFRGGPWAWPGTLPFSAGTAAVTLGEGNTPLIADPGVEGLLLKLESHNPTGSHKDRAMSVGMTAARANDHGVVVAASSGNAGAAAAAYAARAGLRAIVTTTASIPPALRAQIMATGATLAVYGSVARRNSASRELVDDFDCFPVTNYLDPGPGSNTLAIEGYKSIAYELARDVPEAQCVVVPTSRADLIAGIARGYVELMASGHLSAMPRLVIAEPTSGAAFTTAMGRPRPDQERTQVERGSSPAFSIGSDVANYQGLHALWTSGGHAVAVRESDFMGEYDRLRGQGIWVEASAATAVRAARDEVSSAGPVVAVVTAGGTKDPDLISGRVDEQATIIDPSPTDLGLTRPTHLRRAAAWTKDT